ncbi:MAG: hypothetical protein B7Y88_15545, partial [Sphingomonadales bacterium 32-64-17]
MARSIEAECLAPGIDLERSDDRRGNRHDKDGTQQAMPFMALQRAGHQHERKRRDEGEQAGQRAWRRHGERTPAVLLANQSKRGCLSLPARQCLPHIRRKRHQ